MDNSAIDVIGQWKMPLQITCCIFHCPPLPTLFPRGPQAWLLSARFFSTTADMKQSWPLIIHNHNGNLELSHHKRIFRHLFCSSSFKRRKKSLMSTSRSSISSSTALYHFFMQALKSPALESWKNDVKTFKNGNSKEFLILFIFRHISL